MCGIIGLITTEGVKGFSKRKNFFAQALYADALRGWDSTGIFTASTIKENNPDIAYYKRALQASDFLVTKKAQSILNFMDDYNFVIGHNRAATKGVVSDITAHPFEFENLIGVHNGTLNNHLALPNGKDFSVDSEALLHAMSEYGAKNILEEVRGSFALVWYDKTTGKLNCIRNEERPFSFATIKGEDSIVMASEANMFKWLAPRNGLNLERVFHLSPGKLISFNKENPKEFEMEEIKIQKKVKVFTGNNWDKDSKNRYNSFSKSDRAEAERQLFQQIGKNKGDKIMFVGSKFTPYSPNDIVNGRVIGYLDQSPFLSVIAHSVHNHYCEYDGLKNDYIIGTISGISFDTKGEEILIVKDAYFPSEKEMEKELDFVCAKKSSKKNSLITKLN